VHQPAIVATPAKYDFQPDIHVTEHTSEFKTRETSSREKHIRKSNSRQGMKLWEHRPIWCVRFHGSAGMPAAKAGISSPGKPIFI
jgi:hypothetical protein